MKKIIKPAVHTNEVVEYICDITGETCKWGPAATLEVSCGYPSDRDGLRYELHLSQKGLDKVMKAIKNTLPKNKKMKDFAISYMGLFSEFPTYKEDK